MYPYPYIHVPWRIAAFRSQQHSLTGGWLIIDTMHSHTHSHTHVTRVVPAAAASRLSDVRMHAPLRSGEKTNDLQVRIAHILARHMEEER